MSSISSFDIFNVVVPDPNIFYVFQHLMMLLPVNPNGIKTLLTNGPFSIKDNPLFSNGPRNPPDCIILDNWVFGNLISIDELFAKALRRFVTCLLVNNNS